MWADNIKFVKDIIDSKYNKIDHAVAEVKEMLIVGGVEFTYLFINEA